MLNILDLEKRWFKYKIKSYIPYATITVSLIIIAIAISTFFNSNQEIKAAKKTKQEQSIDTKISKKIPIAQETTQIEKIAYEKIPTTPSKISKQSYSDTNSESLKLAPSLNFMKKMQHSSLPYYQNEVKKVQKVTNAPKFKSQIVEEVQDLEVEVEVKEKIKIVIPQEEVKRISIERRDTQDDIKHIIKRFKNNNNPALSLFIAKKYYELGEYHKAYNYSLITNQINSDIDASWIVFSKSLVKLQQKDKAIKTLKQYIETSHSSAAKILLEEIVSGRFR